MLVLTRRPNERIRFRVGESVVWLTVKRVEGKQVKLAFEGDVEILREEIIDEEPDKVPL